MKGKKCYKLNTLGAALVAIGLVFFISLKVLFPEFQYNSKQPDVHDIVVQKIQIAEKTLFHVAPLFDYEYSLVEVEVAQEMESQKIESILVFIGFVSQVFPETESINSADALEKFLRIEEGSILKNGSLVSYNDTVFFVSNGKARSFLNPETFNRLGFFWGDVEEIGGEVFADLQKGEPLSYSSIHPDGTFLELAGKVYLVFDQKRFELSEGLLSQIELPSTPIKVASEKINMVGTCQQTKKTAGKISCSFVPDYGKFSRGSSYIFVVEGNFLDDAKNFSVKFKTLSGLNAEVARSSLKRIKDTLKSRYFPELIQ